MAAKPAKKVVNLNAVYFEHPRPGELCSSLNTSADVNIIECFKILF